jgi:hypothetical protein
VAETSRVRHSAGENFVRNFMMLSVPLTKHRLERSASRELTAGNHRAHLTIVELSLYSWPKRRFRAALQHASRSGYALVPPTGFGVQHRSAVQPNNLFRLRESAAFKHRKTRQW